MYFRAPFDSSSCPCHSRMVAGDSTNTPLMDPTPEDRLGTRQPCSQELGPAPGTVVGQQGLLMRPWPEAVLEPGLQPPSCHTCCLSPGSVGTATAIIGVLGSNLAHWGWSAEPPQCPGEARPRERRSLFLSAAT